MIRGVFVGAVNSSEPSSNFGANRNSLSVRGAVVRLMSEADWLTAAINFAAEKLGLGVETDATATVVATLPVSMRSIAFGAFMAIATSLVASVRDLVDSVCAKDVADAATMIVAASVSFESLVCLNMVVVSF